MRLHEYAIVILGKHRLDQFQKFRSQNQNRSHFLKSMTHLPDYE